MFRELPSVNELLDHDSVRELIGEHGRLRVTDWVRSAIRTEREKLSESSKPAAEGTGSPVRSDIREAVIEAVTELAARSEWQSMAGVINATGVILHTGLGRAPLSSTARQALLDCAGACNCEVDVETGERRYRGYQVESMLQLLTGAEASLIVNNNAAATLLTLQALCSGREVIISRGELIEIGGSFRLPDIFELSGVRLKEVGTTNRTRLSDYERAITEDTAGIMVVHPSNYRVTGFTGKPDLKEIVALARQRDLVAIDDIGSGSLSDLSASGRPHEPTFQESVAAGADVTLGSGDKLLGGPQSGIIVGRGDLVDRLRNHALARAVRVDKLTLAALDATLAAYVRNGSAGSSDTDDAVGVDRRLAGTGGGGG